MDRDSLQLRPAIFVVGAPNVGKRTLLSRLLNVEFEDAPDSSSELIVHGWTINTKYYTADVAVWMAHISDELSISKLPISDRIVALVLVFDVSNLASLASLKDWVSRTEVQKFDILLCVGNKVDLLPGHSAHSEYRRRLLKRDESSVDSTLGVSEYGIAETEGSSLLGGDESSSWELKRSHVEWCLEHNIEYVEACASNVDFDRSLSVDGDSQGVERLYGALTAHMWPGMVLKSGDRINEPTLPEQEDESEEESDYELEYEVLSSGSAEQWDDVGWMSADGAVSNQPSDSSREMKSGAHVDQPSTSASQSLPPEGLDQKELTPPCEVDCTSDAEEDKAYDFEDLEKLMAEIGNVRNGLRLMSDFQRREMAAKLALKMATMFGDSSGGEEDFVDEIEKM